MKAWTRGEQIDNQIIDQKCLGCGNRFKKVEYMNNGVWCDKEGCQLKVNKLKLIR